MCAWWRKVMAHTLPTLVKPPFSFWKYRCRTRRVCSLLSRTNHAPGNQFRTDSDRSPDTTPCGRTRSQTEKRRGERHTGARSLTLSTLCTNWFMNDSTSWPFREAKNRSTSSRVQSRPRYASSVSSSCGNAHSCQRRLAACQAELRGRTCLSSLPVWLDTTKWNRDRISRRMSSGTMVIRSRCLASVDRNSTNSWPRQGAVRVRRGKLEWGNQL